MCLLVLCKGHGMAATQKNRQKMKYIYKENPYAKINMVF